MSLIEPPAAPRTAIFWGRDDLLGKAIEMTLTTASDWRLIKISDDSDIQTLTREVERLHPEIIFMSLEHFDQELSASICATEENTQLRIVIINPCNNRIEVFSRKVIWIQEISDLLSLISDPSNSTERGGNSETQSCSFQ